MKIGRGPPRQRITFGNLRILKNIVWCMYLAIYSGYFNITVTPILFICIDDVGTLILFEKLVIICAEI